MQSALKLKTTVLAGRRIEVSAPELIEGEDVELIVLRAETPTLEPRSLEKPIFATAAEYLASLLPIHRTPEEWVIIERELREEKDAWDR